MKPPHFQDGKNHNPKRERWFNVGTFLTPFVFFSLLLTTIFSLFLLYSPNSLSSDYKRDLHYYQHDFHDSKPDPHQNVSSDYNKDLDDSKHDLHLDTSSVIISRKDDGDGDGNCDLNKGHWIPDPKGSLYTNYSCITIPETKNCFFQGRQDRGFLNWRWKPYDCELPRFDAKTFLNLVRGKTLAFIGDSVARNHMESLLCLLSQLTQIDSLLPP